MKAIADRYKDCFTDKPFLISFILGILLLIISLVINYFAAIYAGERISNYVSDIVLSNIPVFDVDWIFVYGPLIFWGVISIVCLYDPRKIPFMAKNVALFVVIRSAFITLTHLGPFPDHLTIDMTGPNAIHAISLFSSGGDLFFSGHTGLPFLMALVFWKDMKMRIFCMYSAIFFGAVVLLGHLHYSIDVASAFFITYAIYHIAIRWFAKDQKRFLGVIHSS